MSIQLTADQILAMLYCQTREKLRQNVPKFQGVSHYDTELCKTAAIITENAFVKVVSQQIDLDPIFDNK